MAANPNPSITALSDDDHVQGNPDAPVTVIEYGDYQCGFCAEAYPVVKHLQQRFGGDLRLVFRHFPLAGMHPMALPAAQVAEAAGALGRFWAMHDWLYRHRDQWVATGTSGLQQGLQALDLDASEIAAVIESGEPADRVQEDMAGGERGGVDSTPAFFINGHLFQGNVRDLGGQIEAALARR